MSQPSILNRILFADLPIIGHRRKFWAILRDSLREAVDTKVLYVMLGLSAVLIVVVLSVSFRPVSVEEDLKHVCENVNWAVNMRARQGLPSLHVSYTDFHESDAPEPWKRDYAFTFVFEFPDEATAKEVNRFAGFGPQEIEFVVKQNFAYLDHLHVADAPSQDARQRRFTVTSQGTKVDNRVGWKHQPSLLFGLIPFQVGAFAFDAPLGFEVYLVDDYLVNGAGGWVGILTGILITAFFIPNMLRKGTVDLLLVKPIHRTTLLVFKYLGGLYFMLILAGFTVTGIWLALGLRSGVWAPGFLLTIPVLTFFFAILYSVSTLFGVLTRSPIVAILMTALVWGLLLLVNWLYVPADRVAELRRAETEPPMAGEEGMPPSVRQQQALRFPDWVYTAVRGVHTVLPRTADLNALTTRLIARGALLDQNPRLAERVAEVEKLPFGWAESLGVSGAFIVVLLGLACLRFATADY